MVLMICLLDSTEMVLGGKHINSLQKHKCKFNIRYMLKDDFRFAVQQEKTTYGLGYKMTLTRNKHDAVLNKAETIAVARIKIDNIHWNVPHYTARIPQ